MLPDGGRQHRECIIPQALTHSLVFLKMGKIIVPKLVELTGIIDKPFIVTPSWLSILFIFNYIFLDLLNHLNLFLYRMSCISYRHLLVRKIFTFYINDVPLFKRPFPGPKG